MEIVDEEEETIKNEEKEETEPQPQQAIKLGSQRTIYALRTSIGYERMVADRLALSSSKGGLEEEEKQEEQEEREEQQRGKENRCEIYALLSPANLRGYIFVECLNDREAITNLGRTIKHFRNLVDGEVSISDIEHLFTPKPPIEGIEEGDIVEIISGPFKGEKARVRYKNTTKDEVTVELLDAMVAIPVTIQGDAVRALKPPSEAEQE